MSTDQPSRTPYLTVQDVVRAADTLWPFRLQESWDASGLVTGRPGAVVKRIHLAVD
ncbi:MAG: Nif3-like dinuclear metal center hexameric protein, partial [Kocuria rhizophila]|nr:Nif3-like dinuclear metal center hexameric protein [Kocuria rhizophila]